MTTTEPWLRGIEAGIDPVIGHLLRASEHIREDLAQALHTLTPQQLWAQPRGMTSAGFHAKHLAGSTRRLCTYLASRQLSREQLAEISLEAQGSESSAELIANVDNAFRDYEIMVRALRPEDFATVREIGRRKLQTTAISLAIHIAEHGQRHTGQAISAAKLACIGTA